MHSSVISSDLIPEASPLANFQSVFWILVGLATTRRRIGTAKKNAPTM